MNPHSTRGTALACLLTLSGYTFPALAQQAPPSDDIDSTAYNYPVVITPTRLRQSVADVPASVTIITQDTLRRYGINSIPDALRLVPGMAVTQATGNDFRINYHGTGVIAPRRMNVLIDGFAVYGSTLSQVDWSSLPVAMEDIDRIEVTRGPNSAAYGPNSMMSVINIITRNPRDVEPALVAVGAGSHHTVDTTVRLATKLGERTHLALTANTERNSGYDVSNLPGGPRDSNRVRRANVRTRTEFDVGSSLDLFGSYEDAAEQVSTAGDPFGTSYPDLDQRDSKLGLKWTHALSASHELQIRALTSSSVYVQEWSTCWPQILLHPDVVAVIAAHPAIGGALAHRADQATLATLLMTTPMSLSDQMKLAAALASMGGLSGAEQGACGTTNGNYNESRTQVELQDTYVVSDRLRVVAGAGLRRQESESRTYLSGKVNNMVRWLFGHGEYRSSTALTFNLGGYFESNSLSGDSFSPRVAANYHLTENQTLRAVYSRGTRSPDPLESRGNWAPAMDNLSPPVAGLTSLSAVTLMRGNPDLKEERNTSIELGHMLAVRRLGMVIDTRVFQDRLTTLISNYSTPTQLSPNNDSSVRLAGAETQVNWELASDWSGWMGYAYLVNYQSSNPVERTQWSRHSGSAGVSHVFSEQWQAALSTYHASGDGVREHRYGRTDLTVAHAFKLDMLPSSFTLGMSYLHAPTMGIYSSGLGEIVARYSNRTSLYGKVRVSF